MTNTTTRTRRTAPATATLAAVALLALTGCSTFSDLGDSLSGSDTKEHSVDTGAEGKESQLLASWVPDDASDVKVMQRTTGSERLLTFTHDGDLPADCTAIATPGTPTEEELAASYATDARTADFPVEDWTTTPTLEAEWWPEGTIEGTTHLCGRWWVSTSGSTVYGFAASQKIEPAS
ncbi:hypothetical protein [Litorihabitans aurantiacus]|uniref:Lipoprotein n=1 Tax=Litorihabitans aurantiacus TaxID=1930061 RepID=A0AA37XE84_9MICO|nr:hypothetical protein [Litorihabitans aurantiacus]GMA31559.1 hypothetical protein GCM10025875_15510 [Litorihabitans aurantiacus]